MPTLIARLREALAPHYSVERELGVGGMARVYRARDNSLQRDVAIKVLRPDLATVGGAQRFLREARTLAQLSHPNVVPIHHVGEADGLFYYVMDMVDGDTLAKRLEGGPLPPDQAISITLDLLGALEAVHGTGVVHRDVKPANVFLSGDRALLGDFGIAKEMGQLTSDALTAAGQAVGTPAYMAPEQQIGADVSPRTDLYAIGLILYEAVTGSRYPSLAEPDLVSWKEVPGKLRGPLRRALALALAERWADAASFREALERASAGSRLGLPIPIALALGLLAVVLVPAIVSRDGETGVAPGTYDLAIFPCSTVPQGDSAAGWEIARAAAIQLQNLPTLKTAPINAAANWWSHRGPDVSEAAGAAALGARFATVCRVERPTDPIAELELNIVDSAGVTHGLMAIRGAGIGDTYDLVDSLALRILETIQPLLGRTLSRQSLGSFSGHVVQAVKLFLQGEYQFTRDARGAAEQSYLLAVRSDSSLTIAWWRLAEVRRSQSKEPGIDLRLLYEEHGSELPTFERLTLGARIATPGAERFAMYQEILRQYPYDAYALFNYGDELFHRGPLYGIPVDSAERVLEIAVARDSFLGPALDHVVLIDIRRGKEEEALRQLERLENVYEPLAGAAPSLVDPRLLRQGYLERFHPDSARSLRAGVFGESARRDPGLLTEAVRLGGLYLDLPGPQLELGRLLVEVARSQGTARRNGHLAQAVALMALGRVAESLTQMDSATRIGGGASAHLQAAQWRIIPAVAGLEGMPAEEVDAARDELRALAEEGELDSETSARLSWTLALLAAQRGDPDELARREGELSAFEAEPWAEPLLTFLEAYVAGRADRFEEAARLTALSVGRDSARDLHLPFLRAMVHLTRGSWFERLERPDSAAASWLWHEAVDLVGIPGVRLQAGEVDWALGMHGKLLRARAALAGGHREEACGLLREVEARWDGADPPLDTLAGGAAREMECPP